MVKGSPVAVNVTGVLGENVSSWIPLTVAFALKLIDVGESTDAMVVPMGMPTPVISSPLTRGAVVANPVTEADPAVNVPFKLIGV
jgi:hypothetical protein